jgi:hypothetical protein
VPSDGPLIGHGSVGDEAIGLRVVEELCAREGVRDRGLNGLAIKPFRKPDGVADRFSGLAGKAEDEVAMDDEAKFAAIARKVQRTLHGGALPDVSEDLDDLLPFDVVGGASRRREPSNMPAG